jgi:uncharacterized protein (DUF2252 family)
VITTLSATDNTIR